MRTSAQMVSEEGAPRKGRRGSRNLNPDEKVNWKSIAICLFAGFGGVLFGYDTGYINGVMAMPYFVNLYL